MLWDQLLLQLTALALAAAFVSSRAHPVAESSPATLCTGAALILLPAWHALQSSYQRCCSAPAHCRAAHQTLRTADGVTSDPILQAKRDIAKALRVFTVPENFPVLVHCIHGKDRTGLIIMLIMLLCSIPAEVSFPAPQSLPAPSSRFTCPKGHPMLRCTCPKGHPAAVLSVCCVHEPVLVMVHGAVHCPIQPDAFPLGARCQRQAALWCSLLPW